MSTFLIIRAQQNDVTSGWYAYYIQKMLSTPYQDKLGKVYTSLHTFGNHKNTYHLSQGGTRYLSLIPTETPVSSHLWWEKWQNSVQGAEEKKQHFAWSSHFAVN